MQMWNRNVNGARSLGEKLRKRYTTELSRLHFRVQEGSMPPEQFRVQQEKLHRKYTKLMDAAKDRDSLVGDIRMLCRALFKRGKSAESRNV